MATQHAPRSSARVLWMVAGLTALSLSFAPARNEIGEIGGRQPGSRGGHLARGWASARELDDPPPVDSTPPVIIPSVACPIPGNPPWCRARITLSWAVSDPESTISSLLGCDPVLLLDDTPATGVEFTCTAASQGGTAEQSIILHQDRFGPTLDIDHLRSPYWYFLNQMVIPSFRCIDLGSGLASSGGPTTVGPNGTDCTAPAVFDTSTPGIHNYGIFLGTDVAGNSNANWGVTYRVIDDPGGSFPYVFPRSPEAEAGRAIAIRFTLNGDRGIDVFRDGFPSVEPVVCVTGEVLGPAEEIPPAMIDLVYRADLDSYVLAWKTDAGWAGTCRRLLLGFSDGTDREMDFQLR